MTFSLIKKIQFFFSIKKYVVILNYQKIKNDHKPKIYKKVKKTQQTY